MSKFTDNFDASWTPLFHIIINVFITRNICHQFMGLAAASLFCAVPAAAQNGEKTKSGLGEAVEATMRPLEDLNIRSKKIAPILLAIDGNPYNVENLNACDDLRQSIQSLDEVLGPDADAELKKRSNVNKAIAGGGQLVSSSIPFRGVIRQITGANKKKRERETALFEGITRRSFLKGYAAAKQCETYEEINIQSAESLLGLGDDNVSGNVTLIDPINDISQDDD